MIGRWPDFESPFCAARLLVNADDGGVDDPVAELPILVDKKATFGYCPWQAGVNGTSAPRWWPETLAAGMNSSIGLEFSADYVENIKLAVARSAA